MRVLLVCFGGWSSSILGKRVAKGLGDHGIRAEVQCLPVETGLTELGEFDVALVAPQVRHMTPTVKEVAAKLGKPVLEITMQEYAAAEPESLVRRIMDATRDNCGR